MDAHLFRRFAEELLPHLVGARVTRIQEPDRDVFTFSLDLFSRASTLGRKGQLVLRCGRKEPFLFFTNDRVSANASPTARAMRLRKYAQGRSVRHVVVRWIERELWLLMSGAMPAIETDGGHVPGMRGATAPEAETAAPPAQGTVDGGENTGTTDSATRPGSDALTWLVLRLREGPDLVFSDDAHWPKESDPAWPSREELPRALENWRDWPVLTPSLRRAMAKLEEADAAALLADLQDGGGDLFCLWEKTPDGEKLKSISAWPVLVDGDRDGLVETCREDVLAACTEAGNELVLKERARRAARQNAEPWIRKEKKLLERLELHEEDVARLKKMRDRRTLGLILQASLWNLPASSRLPRVECPDLEGNPTVLALDPRCTVRENMERFFHTARRGDRGLARMDERRAAIEKELADVRARKEAALRGAVAENRTRRTDPSTPLPSLPSTVQLFVSSDGFTLLRGRNAKGNQDVRRMASPHDIWVHAEGGPGSHVVIRRSHGGVTVPDRTLDEAGALAACRSWLRDEPRARLTYCEIRHVRPLKGAAPGTMRMDKVLFTRTVPVDASLETRLAPENAVEKR